jgi:uncharacterized membrane protein YkoI
MTFGKTFTAFAVCGAITAGALVSVLSQAWAFTGERLAGDAKVSLAEARDKALKVFPGTIASEELEKERGGSGLRYSLDIKNGAVVHEVGVDAKTGQILENSVERGGR